MMPHFLLTDENREDKWDCLSLSLQSFLYQHSTLRSMRSVRVLGPLCCPNEPRLSKWFPKVLPFSTRVSHGKETKRRKKQPYKEILF